MSITRLQLLDQPTFIPTFDAYSHFKGKSIGLTGHRGVLGGILLERLSEHAIHIETYPSDIKDDKNLKAWFEEYHFDYFFHFASIVPVEKVMRNPLLAYETNVVGNYNICKQIIENQPNCWLFLASSSHVYRPNKDKKEQPLTERSDLDPNTFYGVTKLAGERIAIPILKTYDIYYCIGRIFSFSSARQKGSYLVPTLARRIQELPDNGVLEVANGKSVRDIMDAETIIDCVLYLARCQYKGTLNIGSGKGVCVEDIARHLANKLNKRIQVHCIERDYPDFLVADVQKLKNVILQQVCK